MSKTAELIRLITVLILAIIIAGVAGYFVPRIGRFLDGESVVFNILPEKQASENSFGEQAALQRRFAAALQKDIVSLIEKTTGPGTVYATVQADLNLTRETVHQKDVIPSGDSFEGSALAPEGRTDIVFQDVGLPDFSVTKSWIQSTAGVVQRLSVSVLIDGQMVRDQDGSILYQPRTRAEMENYTALIKAVVGFEAERGDTLEVLNLPFSEEARVVLGIRPAVWVQGLCLLLLLGIVIWLSFYFIVPMMRRLAGIEPVRAVAPRSGRSSLEKVIFICRQTPERAVRVLKNWIHQPSKKERGYSAVQQAAILILTVGDDVARDLFRRMDEKDIRLLGQAMGALGGVCAEDVQICLEQFAHDVSAPGRVTGTSEQVRQVFERTMPKETGDRLYSEIRLAAGGQTVWSRLNMLDTGLLVSFLSEQKPETTALILYHLSDTVSARVLGLLPKTLATRVMIHLTHLRHIRSDVRQKLEREIAVQVCELIQQAQSRTGAEKASAILRAMDGQDKAGLMASVSAEEPAVADEMAVWMMRFEDFAKWPDSRIRLLLKHIDRQVAVVALHEAPMAVRDAFVRNMPASVWMSLNREMGRLTPEQLRGKTAARETILKTARELMALKKAETDV